MQKIFTYSISLFFSLLFIGCNSATPPSGFEKNGCQTRDKSGPSNQNTSLNQINIFLETSGSMFGFMPSTASTEFQSDIWKLIASLNSRTTKHLSIYQVKDTSIPLAILDVNTFRNKMNSGQFQAFTSTDIPAMLDSVIAKSTNEAVSILISDLIFSPDNSSNPAPRLAQITTDIRTRFEAKGLASSIFNFNSEFKGKTVTPSKSPYYVWVIGNANEVIRVSSIIRKNFPDVNEVNFGVKPLSLIGSVIPEIAPDGNAVAVSCIEDGNVYAWSDYNDEGLEFYVALNLSEFPRNVQEPKYIKDNIEIDGSQSKSSLISVEINPFTSDIIKAGKNRLAKLNSTHLLKFKFNSAIENETLLQFRFKKVAPLWIESVNSDSDDLTRTSTFGFSNMIKGLEEAYGEQSSSYSSDYFKIWISKNTID